MSSEHHIGSTSVDDPEEMIGRYVRRRRDTAPHDYTPWAKVSMVVPSVDGPCWLVSYPDGGVDVWRIDDAAARYQVRDLHPRSGVQP
ncbi:hypothetical protein PDG61_20430 [Mycolicibacterium sp. BiH015]|uniref:hypothetical protein n=1 Tax=Mycolicibacterium sp. BiH015 TaxID=3018808 RepID=UPI0022E09F22|nr:hypothetical protein [Mycolicibacterium sp. BiH015]MDA2893295.1 hypothetical protein [Mycolicibacterium sp. BiH015]